ncbi:unnamed protein product [Soboliphyme baturini]|uniref:SERPIN domain-containing protein n=1 Tax=Soboliphyme baturini TaxID=241478 RepID=A0A183J6Q4_9BILA|nr:unnamed protein product [Soboliphyme baturini]
MEESATVSAEVLNDFAISLYRNSAASSESLCVSPTSVMLALAMVFYGAAGKTKTQIRQALFGSSLMEDQIQPYLAKLVFEINKKDKSFVLDVANRVYSAENFKISKSYSNTIQKDLHASIVPVNFSNVESTVGQINKWVADSTHNKIKEIISAESINPLTRLVVLNAIYFQSQWLKVFSPEETTKMKFYVSSSKNCEVDMMFQKDYFLYAENDEFQVLVLKYLNSVISMNIFLPKEKFGLENLEQSLTANKLKSLMNSVHRIEVLVKVPKFKLESDVRLKDVLMTMGITDIFTLEADLSGITESRELYVSEAKHKTSIEVDEMGTKAAAVTGFEMVAMSALIEREPVVFTADHPFMFIIIDNRYKNILFIGRYIGQS